MKTQKEIILILLLPLFLLTACNRPFSGFDKSDSGMYYKFHLKHECDHYPIPGDLVTFMMKLSAEDTVFIDSKQPIVREPMDTSRYPGDLYEALGMLCKGDSATFIISSDSLSKYFGFSVDTDAYKLLNLDILMMDIITPEMFAREQDSLMTRELVLFEDYKKDSLADFIETAPGVLYKERVRGSGRGITDESVISVVMSGRTLEGIDFIPKNNEPFDFRLADSQEFSLNWNSALRNLRDGSKATIVLSSPNAFGRRGFANDLVPPFSTIILDVEIVNVSKGMKEFEEYSIKQFVKRNNITEKPTSSGLYKVVEKEGEGALLNSKDKVLVHYTGYYLDMAVFDSSRQRGKPTEVVVDVTEVVEGWHEALKMMRVGERARIIIPSSLAYGSEGYPPLIGPYSPLIFDIEIIEKL